jgi:hypothetical protein
MRYQTALCPAVLTPLCQLKSRAPAGPLFQGWRIIRADPVCVNLKNDAIRLFIDDYLTAPPSRPFGAILKHDAALREHIADAIGLFEVFGLARCNALRDQLINLSIA